jgi:hypothetical protein
MLGSSLIWIVKKITAIPDREKYRYPSKKTLG